MIENYRTQAVWNRFMQNPDVQRGLHAAGFTQVIGIGDTPREGPPAVLLQNVPNPFHTSSVISYRIDVETEVTLHVYDVSGRRIRSLVEDVQGPGEYRISLAAADFPSGIYFYRLETGGRSLSRRMTVIR